MNGILIYFLIVLLAFICMEVVAWSAHKYLMHGALWSLHKDHHNKRGHSPFEHNDLFFLLFAIPGIIALYFGIYAQHTWLLCCGIGITLYGLTYFLVHDIFIHRRLKFLRNSKSRYFTALRRAHKIHHKHLGKNDGECFGMLLVPRKYYRR